MGNIIVDNVDELIDLLNNSRSDMPALYHSRKFLNDEGHGGSAHVRIEVHPSWNKEKKGIPNSGTITIFDCSDQIELDIGFQDKAKFIRGRNKINRLITELQGMLEYMESVEDIIPEIEEEDEDD